MIDLREEFNELVEETGHYILLQRTSRKIRCRCWNEKYQEAESTCPFCLGKGWVSRIERHKVRKQIAVNIISLPNRIQKTDIGRAGIDTNIFYFKHDVHPKVGDVIMEVGWDSINPYRPTHLVSAYEINFSDGLREQGGRIEYYRTATKEIVMDVDARYLAIRKIGPVLNYEILGKKEERT